MCSTVGSDIEDDCGVPDSEIASGLINLNDIYELENKPNIQKVYDVKGPGAFGRIDHLSSEEAAYVSELVSSNRDVFYLPGDDLPGTDIMFHRINTTDEIPVNVKQ